MDKKSAKTTSKRVSMTDLIGATGATPPRTKATVSAREIRPDDKVMGVSLTLRESEFAELQNIAEQHHASRGSLMTALMRYAMRDMRAGKFKLKTSGLKFVDP